MANSYTETARERMRGFCRVCPACDGRACSGEVPGMGGLGTGASFRNNFAALERVTLNMSALHGVKKPDTSATILGMELKLPVMAAPVGGASFNMSKDFDEDDFIEAILSGCEAAGTLGCTGDGVPPFIIDSAVKALSGHKGIPFIKPWEGNELHEKLERVMECRPAAVGMDIDAAGLVTLGQMGRSVAPMDSEALASVIAFVHKKGYRFIVKGIMTPRDAQKAVDAGADAIVVSNHGGRILDHCPGTAAVLPRIAEAVRGRTAIIADGAVRTGTHVLKMLALGADAVFVGRPVCIAAVGGSAAGVREYFDGIADQLGKAMLLTGAGTIADITGSMLFNGGD